MYYIHRLGEGEVLYLNLGHCRGHYDMRPLMDYYPQIERGSWEKPDLSSIDFLIRESYSWGRLYTGRRNIIWRTL